MPQNALVRFELSDSMSHIVMDDGKVNVLTQQMFDELNAALDRAATANVSVVLQGRNGAFSAGFDLNVLKAGGEQARQLMKSGFELAERILSFPHPVIIACPGHAFAMGVFLLLSGDYRIGARGAFKIGANEVAIGLTMPHFAIEICRQRLTPPHFNRALLLSELYSPDAATEAGFLDQVVEPEALLQTALSKARELNKLNFNAHAASKVRVRSQALKAIRAAIEYDDELFTNR